MPNCAQLRAEDKAAELGITCEEFARQCALEMEGFDLGVQRYRSNVTKVYGDSGKDNTTLGPESRVIHHYINHAAIAISKAASKRGRGGSEALRKARRVLKELAPERLAFVGLQFALNITPFETAFTNCCFKLGKRIEHDYEYQQLQQQAPGFLTVVERNLKTAHLSHRHKVLTHAKNTVQIRDEDNNVLATGIKPLKLDPDSRMLIGKIVLEAISIGTGLFEVVQTRKRQLDSGAFDGWKNVYVVQRTEKCERIIQEGHGLMELAHPVCYPLVVAPKPWEGPYGGGFWTQYKSLRTKLIRTTNRKAIARADSQGLDCVQDAVNIISRSKYRINKRVLDVLEAGREFGLGGLPAMDPEDIDIGGTRPLAEPCPWSNDEIKRLKEAGDPAWRRWTAQRARAYNAWGRECSKRIGLEWKLKIARKFADEPAIYFCGNLDYRGRFYYFQPYLNPQMDDSGRGLLEFAEAKPLGKHGLRWLKIHGANEYGFDKATLDERVQWVDDNEYNIFEAALNPVDGSRWWADAEHPYQFLAFCFEYHAYVTSCAGEAFESRLPLQVDGTCSGLQHYSAMLRDARGAAAVNLVPSGRKADVYAEVAAAANRILKHDVAEGGDNAHIAKAWLEVGVGRAEAKRNTMTFVYGATQAGFRQQMLDHIDKKAIELPGIEPNAAANYLGDVNWRAVAAVLVKSVEAMSFLQKLAFLAAKNQMDIQWTTPVGLRVTQDYLKTKSKRISTWWGDIKITPRIQVETAEKNAVGARNGIAPNFIHSLDASHLMLTVLRCAEEGIDAYSLIHDSFGCHAGHMHTMNRVIRETFNEMYSDDLLFKFVADVRSQISDAEVLVEFDALVSEHMPAPGDLELSCVLESDYFFS